MAQQLVNVGTAPNDGTGDTLKTSFTKCNANFTELYGGGAAVPYVLRAGDSMTGSLYITPTAATDGLRLDGAANQGQIIAQGAHADVGIVITSKGNSGVTLYSASFGRPCLSAVGAPGSNTFINFTANVGYSSVTNNPLGNTIYFGSPVDVPAGSTAITPTVGDNTNKIATTAFVKANSGPAKIGFSAYPSADQTGVVNSVWTKVQFASVVYNDSSLFNTTTHRWTPPAGRCQLSAGVYFSVAAANTGLLIGTQIFISIYKNGVLFRHVCGSCVSEASSGVFITIMDACNGTDYYEVFAYGVTAGNTFTINASAAALGTFFMGTTL